jgi:hypothetical protein
MAVLDAGATANVGEPLSNGEREHQQQVEILNAASATHRAIP